MKDINGVCLAKLDICEFWNSKTKPLHPYVARFDKIDNDRYISSSFQFRVWNYCEKINIKKTPRAELNEIKIINMFAKAMRHKVLQKKKAGYSGFMETQMQGVIDQN